MEADSTSLFSMTVIGLGICRVDAVVGVDQAET
jgi:hypothetical protein